VGWSLAISDWLVAFVDSQPVTIVHVHISTGHLYTSYTHRSCLILPFAITGKFQILCSLVTDQGKRVYHNAYQQPLRMSLPERRASVRTSTTDTRKLTPRPAQASQVRKIQETDGPKKASTATSAKDSTVASQGLSRIPSPFKRDSLNSSSYSHQANTDRSGPPLRGHSRQRSAVLPPPSTRPKLGHQRSISVVSVNTTSTSGSDVSRAPARSRVDARQSPAKPTKPQVAPHSRVTALEAPSLRPNSVTGHLEKLHNEFLQLSIVHKKSPQALQAFERSIAISLSNSRSALVKVRADVYAQKHALSTASNLLAVDNLLQELGYQKTCQFLQDLSVAVRDLHNLERIFEGEDGLVAEFDVWRRNIVVGSVSEDKQDTTFDYASMHVMFDKELAPELQRFKLQVASLVATMASLSGCASESSMSLIIQEQSSVASGLLSECQVLLQIGNQLVSEQRQWLDQEITAAISENDTTTNFGLAGPKPLWDE